MRPGRVRVLGLSNRAIMLFLFGIAIGVFCIMSSLVSMLESAAKTGVSQRRTHSSERVEAERAVRLVDAAAAGDAFGGACALVSRWGALEVWWFGKDGKALGGVPAVGSDGRIAGCGDRLVVASERGLTEIWPDGRRDVADLPDGYTAPGPDTPVSLSASDASHAYLSLGSDLWALNAGIVEPCKADPPMPDGLSRPRIEEDQDRQWVWLPLAGEKQATVVLEGETLRLNTSGRPGTAPESEAREDR